MSKQRYTTRQPPRCAVRDKATTTYNGRPTVPPRAFLPVEAMERHASNYKEAAGFDKSIAMYVEHATKLGGRRKAAPTSERDYEPKAVRAWAKRQGLDVPGRGRIPAEVLQQYKQAG